MRTVVQALSLVLFTLLFLWANWKLPDWLPADVYLRLDPLLGLSAVLAGREIVVRALWSLVLIGATLAIGRFFCGYVCPLAAAIDFLDVPFFGKKSRRGLRAMRLGGRQNSWSASFSSARLPSVSPWPIFWIPWRFSRASTHSSCIPWSSVCSIWLSIWCARSSRPWGGWASPTPHILNRSITCPSSPS
jgi:hypothetical protein